MTPDEIAHEILSGLMPEARKLWRHEITSEDALLALTFRCATTPMVLDIGPVLARFGEAMRNVSWQNDDDGRDSPRIVIQGGVNGKLVQVVFVLSAPEE